ncbi:ribbon-helix-helix protein, CopG family [Sinorhizobium fredii]|uniref:ribbon-helix-helix protein, CopG family n=1 Tax=Rhizobium fredii TaxID=380 RepID=UPI001427A2C5|nr:ribbon-helix-helix protein, CopG family [Sinorhizobium fredii]
MSHVDRTVNRQRVSAHREKVRAAGRTFVNTDLPTDLVDCLDRIKEERGMASRAQVFEEALRAYVENEMRA